MTITLKISVFDPMLIKPKSVQKCMFSEIQPFELANFDLGHPIVGCSKYFMNQIMSKVGNT